MAEKVEFPNFINHTSSAVLGKRCSSVPDKCGYAPPRPLQHGQLTEAHELGAVHLLLREEPRQKVDHREVSGLPATAANRNSLA